MALHENGAGGRDKIMSVLSELITSSTDFNRCVDNDCFLTEILNEKLSKLLGIVSSDMFFFENNMDSGESLKAYHTETGEQINYSVQGLISESVMCNLLLDKREGDQIITVTQMLQKDPNFNREVDMPINKEKIIEQNQTENNVFNKIRHLSLVMVKIQYPVKVGILRLFFSCPQGGNSPTQLQMHKVS